MKVSARNYSIGFFSRHVGMTCVFDCAKNHAHANVYKNGTALRTDN